LPWVKVTPYQARRFAQATGKLAKTDRCDALTLARMGAVLDLEPRAPASKTVEALKELVNARDALIKDRVAALNRQAIAVSPLIKRQLTQRCCHGNLALAERSQWGSARVQAAVAACQFWNASPLRARSVLRETRWR
jgi:transposase